MVVFKYKDKIKGGGLYEKTFAEDQRKEITTENITRECISNAFWTVF